MDIIMAYMGYMALFYTYPSQIMKKTIPASVPKRCAARFHAEPRYSCAEISFLDPFGELFLKLSFLKTTMFVDLSRCVLI